MIAFDGRNRSAMGLALLLACGCIMGMASGCGRGDRAPETSGGTGDTLRPAPPLHEHAEAGALGRTRLDFRSVPAAIPVGAPAEWTLTIRDRASGAPVKDFDTVHAKLLHLIVVSSDLTWFNHVHPEYRGEGVFTVKTVLPRAGSYKLYADYTLAGGAHDVEQYELATGGGTYRQETSNLVADTIGEGGWMVRTVASRPEGMPDEKGGAEYQVALMPMPMKLVAGRDAMLHFQIRDAGGKPVKGLEPYLGAMGHAVLLSADTKTYLHTHPMEPGAGHGGMHHEGEEHAAVRNGMAPGHGHGTATLDEEETPGKPASEVIFHTNFPNPGLYKVWGQFRHMGRIITASFVLNVEA
ncbi:MAG TPA: hypothetical protein VHI13_15930 [Candidatus Kapabacteria bacterium]|nr:hypothetical protein [Candidatus Kapabacteria bacterium]